jgi:molybdopterin-guanine dinucleotide biosynthesis protein B
MCPVDLILVEGYKRDAHAKLEVHREANGKPWLYPDETTIAAIATDARDALPTRLPHAHLDDIDAVAGLILAHALDIKETIFKPAT